MTQVFDLGTHRLEIAPPRGWEATVNRQQGYILFQHSDKPALTVQATIGLFKLWVPVAGRHRSHEDIAASYASQDAAGYQQALFKSNAHLRRLNRKPEPLSGGELFPFAELSDVSGRRLSSTSFVRAWVFIPSNFRESGTLFFAIGRQDSRRPEIRPDELEWAPEIFRGISER